MAGTMEWMFVVSKSDIGLYDLDLFLVVMFYRFDPMVNHHEQPPFFGFVFLELVPSIKASNTQIQDENTGPSITPFFGIPGATPPQDEKVWWIPP